MEYHRNHEISVEALMTEIQQQVVDQRSPGIIGQETGMNSGEKITPSFDWPQIDANL